LEPEGGRAHALPGIAGFAAVQLAGSKSSPGPSRRPWLRLRLAGGRELLLPGAMPTRRLVKLLLALEGKAGKPEGGV